MTSPHYSQALVVSALPQLTEPAGWGVVLLLYSVLLTRGTDNVRHRDMDDPGLTLVAAHGHCSSELVALLLTGRAVSNVFDGERRFGDDDPAAQEAAVSGDGRGGGGDADAGASCGGGGAHEELVLRGVKRRSVVGLLTLFEWYR